MAGRNGFALLSQWGPFIYCAGVRGSKHYRQKRFLLSRRLCSYDAVDSLPAAFVASPVFDGDKRIGVLLFELSIHDINDVMTSGAQWEEEEGLGKTGETYIVGADFTMRNDSCGSLSRTLPRISNVCS